MKIKDIIKELKKQDQNRELVLWNWNETKDESGRFFRLELTCNPKANSNNLFVLRTTNIIKHQPEED